MSKRKIRVWCNSEAFFTSYNGKGGVYCGWNGYRTATSPEQAMVKACPSCGQPTQAL